MHTETTTEARAPHKRINRTRNTLTRNARTRTSKISRARTRAHQLGMTLIEIMIVMVIMALVATAAGFAIIPQLNKAKIKQSSTDAKAVSAAVEMYMAEHDDCPSMDQLLSEKIMAKDKNTKDAWGNDFSIECDDDGATVRSAGPDEQMGSEDDIQ